MELFSTVKVPKTMLLLVLGLLSKKGKEKKTLEDEGFHHKYSFPLDFSFPPEITHLQWA